MSLNMKYKDALNLNIFVIKYVSLRLRVQNAEPCVGKI